LDFEPEKDKRVIRFDEPIEQVPTQILWLWHMTAE
jgi:hypothetical protein